MPIILVSCAELLAGGIVPSQLSLYITQQQWSRMCDVVTESYAAGQIYACAGECIFCWCLTPLIFLCHPCYAAAFTSGTLSM